MDLDLVELRSGTPLREVRQQIERLQLDRGPAADGAPTAAENVELRLSLGLLVRLLIAKGILTANMPG